MYKLPLETHRYFVEPITGKPHTKTTMMKNFIRFCELIMNGEKIALTNVFLQLKGNIRSFIGNYLRKILSLLSKDSH